MMKRFCVVFFVCLCCFGTVFSQNVKADLIKVNQVFDQNESLSVDIVFSFYCSKNTAKAEESKTTKLAKLKNAVYTEGFGLTTVIDGEITLLINEMNKTMRIQKTEKKISFSDLGLSISKILDYSEKTTFTETAEEKLYQLLINKLGIEKMLIHIRKKDFTLISVDYYQYGETDIGKSSSKNCKNPVSKISFQNYSKTLSIDKNKLSANFYVTKQKDGTYKPTKQYEKYTIINKINKK